MTEPKHSRGFRALLFALAATAAISITLAGWALYGRFTQTNAYRADTNRVWHAVICQIEKSFVLKAHLPAKEERAALRFYDHLLTADVQTTGCGLIHHAKGNP